MNDLMQQDGASLSDAPNIVIMGASGDLTKRLLLPAIHRFLALGKLPPSWPDRCTDRWNPPSPGLLTSSLGSYMTASHSLMMASMSTSPARHSSTLRTRPTSLRAETIGLEGRSEVRLRLARSRDGFVAYAAPVLSQRSLEPFGRVGVDACSRQRCRRGHTWANLVSRLYRRSADHCRMAFR